MLLYLIIPFILSHRTLRYSGSHHEQISSPVAEEWFDSAGGCANYCRKTAGCGAYSTLHYGEDSAETFRGYKCQIGGGELLHHPHLLSLGVVEAQVQYQQCEERDHRIQHWQGRVPRSVENVARR